MTSHARSHAAGAAPALTPPPGSARLWLFVLVVGLPLLLSAAALAIAPLTGRATPQPAGGVLGAIALQLASVAMLTVPLWAALDWALRRQALRIDHGELDVRSTFFRSRVALAQLQLAQARVIDLDEHLELRPQLKTRGYSLPGLRSGWYRLRNKCKAFVATADSRHVLWLPTAAGHALLLDVRDPHGLLALLHERCGHAR
ncbi:hypothetical protein MWN52_13380 [Pseudoxanthomonas winnipegensis]|uniref:hypothetical protein n=1 Tax=Pseudoxanthomonas winnipegensis TaxID=2480810 RepID=UPI0025789FFF|nr:hypothetical protein [Pseudoxanthomonas winnipegensis]WJI14614.1 hypothetical protein MWN52_13380 [Pseudoxanthomonas winnipegensis]